MPQLLEPESPLEQADTGAPALCMQQRSADEESVDLHTAPSSRRVSVSSDLASSDRGELVRADTSTSYRPCGWVSVAATTIYGCSLPAFYQACSTAGDVSDWEDGCRWIWQSGVGATLASSTIMSFNAGEQQHGKRIIRCSA